MNIRCGSVFLLLSALSMFTSSIRPRAAQPAFDVSAIDRFAAEQLAAQRLPGLALALLSLLRLPRWSRRARMTPLWRLAPGIVWTFVPGAVVVSLPWMVAASSDRVFDYASLFRSMPEVFIWLGSSGALGVVNGIARIAVLVRRRTQE
jgi:hypothetical protein